jgi:serine/threonine-protein kinase RsbW
MEIKLTLALPRDELSVPVVRNILKGSLETLGVTDDCISDIQIALSEACSNVLQHADGHEEYEVACGIDGTLCLIEVVDRGVGFVDGDKGLEQSMTAENGRGIQLMRALVDKVRFEQKHGDGTIVHLEKQLVWHEGAALTRLSRTPTTRGPWSGDDLLEGAAPPR